MFSKRNKRFRKIDHTYRLDDIIESVFKIILLFHYINRYIGKKIRLNSHVARVLAKDRKASISISLEKKVYVNIYQLKNMHVIIILFFFVI